MASGVAVETIESLKLKNLKLEYQVRELKLQVLGLMMEDIRKKVPDLQVEMEALAQEINNLSPKPETDLKAIK